MLLGFKQTLWLYLPIVSGYTRLIIWSSGFLFIWSSVVKFGHIVFIYVQFRSNGPVSFISVTKLVFIENPNSGFRMVENRANCKLSDIRMVRRQNPDSLVRYLNGWYYLSCRLLILPLNIQWTVFIRSGIELQWNIECPNFKGWYSFRGFGTGRSWHLVVWFWLEIDSGLMS